MSIISNSEGSDNRNSGIGNIISKYLEMGKLTGFCSLFVVGFFEWYLIIIQTSKRCPLKVNQILSKEFLNKWNAFIKSQLLIFAAVGRVGCFQFDEIDVSDV